jgi:hypothetical protein
MILWIHGMLLEWHGLTTLIHLHTCQVAALF